MPELNILALFLAGLLGGGHCLGMCGGVVAAFSIKLPPGPRWPHQLAFNLGRISGYTLIGMILGAMASFASIGILQEIKLVLYVLANLLLVLMGAYVAGWNRWLLKLEALGAPVWRHIQPLLRTLLPVRHVGQSLAVGLLWGWMPCGLVYTASLSALASASPWQGAGIMLAFGLGTLPNLLLIGSASGWLLATLRRPLFRQLAGGALMLLGLWRLLAPLF
ncbi:sulfite exporter TauE/SafE family protein [Chitinilyticum litopenaei]|uniref:sulfite exporter TauE/SafE family protein n=1 Tax=Chitinilyticum litopenaei TaxID=1121276 RepID=UPI00042967A5|nr:sulfite exporter TauE/SafE family protein [Chitinilyticum litopenaei]